MSQSVRLWIHQAKVDRGHGKLNDYESPACAMESTGPVSTWRPAPSRGAAPRLSVSVGRNRGESCRPASPRACALGPSQGARTVTLRPLKDSVRDALASLRS